jgi:DNA-binding FadR family transcriptional regulator
LIARWNFSGKRPPALARHFAVLKAIRASDLSPTERHVLRLLEDYADNDTGHAYPSVRTIARDTGYSRSTIETALDSLQAKGWLRVQPKASPIGTNLYQVTPPSGPPEPADNEPDCLPDAAE